MRSGVNLKKSTGSVITATYGVPSAAHPEKHTVSFKKPEHQMITFDHEEVLLVEDNTVNCLVASTLLRNWGLNVTTAVNGAIAVDLALRKPFSLILMDIQMPEMDGIAATRKIKEAGASADTPIVALTANVMPEQIQEYLSVGMVDVVSKPFLALSLNETVAKYLKKPSDSYASTYSFFDPGKFAERSMGDKEAEEELRTAFFQFTPPALTALESAIEVGDHSGVAKILHSLKGVVILFASEALSRDIIHLEENITSATHPEYKQRLGLLIQNVRRMMDEFNTFQ